MERLGTQDRAFLPGFVAVLLVGSFLGIRAGEAVRMVLGVQAGAERRSSASSPAKSEPLVAVARRDSLIAAAGAFFRDPFHPAAEPVTLRPPPLFAPPPPIQPTLRALLFDPAVPLAQIAVGSAISGWLHPGEVFQGWTVEEISAKSVRLSRAGETVNLFAP